MDNALTGAMTDVTDNVWTVLIIKGIFSGNLHFSNHDYQGISMGFQLMVME